MNRRLFGKIFLVSALLISSWPIAPYRIPDQIVFAVAGDRKVRIQEIHISSGNPVPWRADWQLFVEDKLGNDRFVTGGSTTGDFGTPAAFNAMTGAQMRTSVKNAVLADINLPANDSVN